MENYSFSVAWSAEDGEYIATSSEFAGLMGIATNPEDAIGELRAAMEVAVEALREDGEPIPQPRHAQEYSGQLRLRLPRSLHAAAAERAKEEEVSLNALLQTYVAQGLAASQHVPALSVLREEVGRLRCGVEAWTRAHGFHAPHHAPAIPAAAAPQELVRYAVVRMREGSSARSAVHINDFQTEQTATVRPVNRIPVSLLPQTALQ